jgi:hypothetical protein
MVVEMKEYIRGNVADEVECQDDAVKGHDKLVVMTWTKYVKDLDITH